MVPKPIGSNAQKQRLTTALKNICRDYPAGGTVIRELLQNADDAGATEVRFVLDKRTHPTQNLIDDHLAQYQGPALLSFNNAIFRVKDFESLSRLGDSLKLNDGATTGRFGRGFNSVYNWTDSPSIVSRERLLILDPHEEWSNGGNVYDFVEDASDPAIQSQMETYKTIIQRVDEPFNGTVIRIPLRNKNQTLKSEISSRFTSASDIQDVLKTFAEEFGKNGLLFMRNVTKLQIVCSGMSLMIEMVDGQNMQRHKTQINGAVRAALSSPDVSFQYDFEAGIRYTFNGESSITRFMIQHSIQCTSMDAKLRAWAKEQQLIPWVAVAAQLPIPSTEKCLGSLFTVLPLPLNTIQPIHMHALFSLSPDRARLHHLQDKSTQDTEPAEWNDWLFKDGIPVAWAKLLCALAKLHPFQPLFEMWPQLMDNKQDPLSHAVEKVIGIIGRESLALWPTDTGYVNARDGLLASGSEKADLKEALRQAMIPVVFVPKGLHSQVKPVFGDRTLSPANVCALLKSKRGSITAFSGKTKCKLLDYILQNPGSCDFGDLEIFPFEDGIFRSLTGVSAFVHRDKSEKALFSRRPSRNLVLESLSASSQEKLKLGCESSNLHPSIRFRSVEELQEYCMQTIFKNFDEEQDMRSLDADVSDLIAKVWTWITERGISIENPHLSSLWLFPLSNGQHRQVMSGKATRTIYLAPRGLPGEVMLKIDGKLSSKPLPLLCTGEKSLGRRHSAIVKDLLGRHSVLGLANGAAVLEFLRWLNKVLPLVELDKDGMHGVAQAIAQQPSETLTPQDRQIAIDCIRNLRIFHKVTWEVEGDVMKPRFTWTSLGDCKTSVGLLDNNARVPDIPGVQFLATPTASPQQEILESWKLARCVSPVEVVQDHIIPAWQSGICDQWSSICKEHMAAYILGSFSTLSLRSQSVLQTIAIVPVSTLGGQPCSKFSKASELIDPTARELTDLCFEDEEIVPKSSFFRDFHVALKGCGVKTTIDEDVIHHRVLCYASGRYLPAEVRSRACRLLRASCRWTSSVSEQVGSNLKSLAWLPTNKDGVKFLSASTNCRGIRDRLLVNSQLPILETHISESWESRLGWSNVIPGSILLSQLQHGILQKSREIIDAVLVYISEHNLTIQLAPELKDLQCIVVHGDFFVQPSQAFRPPALVSERCHGLHPYFANVDHKFWRDHEKLLTLLGVRDKPNPSDLLRLQDNLDAKGELDAHDTAVAIELLKLVASCPRDTLPGIKILGASGRFHGIGEIYYNDMPALRSKQDLNLTHPEIPMSIINKLKIDSVSAQRVKGILEIDDDEDEFDQQENAITRVSDTLERYPIESTFREYLANADDTDGASKITWVLDDRTHPCRMLITSEMKDLQGPSLLCHNDGVFSEHDFNGFKNVGEGSKMQNKGSIGQFGRGSQTMFHFTDYPMILSGDYLLILDPQQEVLPMNPIKGRRKPGVKLKLSRIREICSDQLVPFEGFFDYNLDLDHFPGTIFRFPLVTATSKGSLRTSKRDLNSNEICRLMDTYFDEARTSLLFLRRIKSIEFYIHGKPDSGWRIDSDDPIRRVHGSNSRFSQTFFCNFTKHKEFGKSPTTGRDDWYVSIQDQSPEVELPPATLKRTAKKVECGMAALVSSFIRNATDGHPSTKIEARMFNTLPLSIPSDLPIHVHATFSLSGDRKSIALDEYGSSSPGSESNRYLLQDALPKLYLGFLNDLAEWVHQDVFKFWPQPESPKRSFGSHIFDAFWKELPSSELKVLPAQSEHPDTGPNKVLSMSQAVFDFLPSSQSDALLPLLLSLGVDLVRNIPRSLIKSFKQVPDLNLISGPTLRSLMKMGTSGPLLLKAMTSKPEVWDVLFNLIAPKSISKEDTKELDGCHILPVADKRFGMGTLRILDEAEPASYYVVSDDVAQIFNFASSKLIIRRADSHIEELLGKAKFNFEPLRLCHVEELLKLRPNVSMPGPADDLWLTSFWQYWNEPQTVASIRPEVNTFDAKLYRATCNAVASYIAPREFDILPAILVPPITNSDERQLCESIPGLYLVDPQLTPKSLQGKEKDLRSVASFSRFIRAIATLGKPSGAGQFVHRYLGQNATKILRDFVLYHVNRHILYDERSGLAAHLQSLLLWPSFVIKPSTPLISASFALIATDSSLLMPWMKDSARFIDPQFVDDETSPQHASTLKHLDVQKVSVDTLLRDYLLPLPNDVGNKYWKEYKVLVDTIAETTLFSHDILRTKKFAIDGTGTLKKISELFDHSNSMFKAAFALETRTRFVHDELKTHLSLWLKCGLRHEAQNFVDPNQYLECLRVMATRAIANRTQDPTFSKDMQAVLSPLTTINQRMRRFTQADWQAVSRQRVFQSRTNFNGEYEHQWDNMAVVAREKPIQSLSELISQAYLPICWSQVPFAIHEPAAHAFDQIPRQGKPQVGVVWRHLQTLKAISLHLKPRQIRDYLEDLKQTYQYLQDHLNESIATFVLSDNVVWLNVNDWIPHTMILSDLQDSWQSLDKLVLSSSVDSGPIKAVRPGLMLYEKLLRGLGCQSITYPTVALPHEPEGYSLVASLRRLRKEEKLVDVSFMSEGRMIKAHTVVLSSVSDYCKGHFSHEWADSGVISYDKTTDPDFFLSYRTLEFMIDFAYEEPLKWDELQVLETDDATTKSRKRDMLLDLCKGADYWGLESLLAQAERRLLAAGRELIDLDNVITVRKVAKSSGAKHFAQLCQEFEDRNRDAVDRAHSQESA